MYSFGRGVVVWLWVVAAITLLGASPRHDPPRPTAGHPGNIFVEGEEVAIDWPADAGPYRAVDYDGKKVAEGDGGARIALGRLPVGYYEIHRAAGGSLPVSLAVLKPLAKPTPETSPIACDVAMAWFYDEAKMSDVATLSTLAGMNWVRDRLSWGEAEPGREAFAEKTRYDASAAAQAAAGLKVLQVHHDSPAWAGKDRKRFPDDLRDAYRFSRAVAARWQGKVLAFEPWNEADISMFGGHTGAEIASLQKAAYLGLKAGNPQVIVCQNVFADHRRTTLEDFHANQAWPYFDTFNLHHYAPLEQYPAVYADFRAVSAGRPMAVTECNVPVQWSGDEARKEPSDADLRLQAERVAKIFAASLHEGSAATFYFLLPHYVEGKIQFGVLRLDLTPRPAFAALAAVGRLLADAKPLGQLKSSDAKVCGYAFRAAPDGEAKTVVVAWSRDGETPLALPVAPSEVYDHLGRKQAAVSESMRLTTAPTLLVFAPEAAAKLSLAPPPAPLAWLEGKPASIVLGANWPQDRVSLDRSAYRIVAQKAESIPVFLYNFAGDAAEARLTCTVPEGWKAQFPDKAHLAAGERTALSLEVVSKAAEGPSEGTIVIVAQSATGGKAVLSLRLLAEAK